MVSGVQMVGVFVSDFDACVRFYRDVLGIPLQVDAHGDEHHADYSFRDPYFHIAIFPSEGDRDCARTHLSFRVEDCRKLFERAIAAGAEAVQEPRWVSYSGGGLSAQVLDPDGNRVELFQAAPSP